MSDIYARHDDALAEIERLRAVVCALVDTWDETPVHIDLYLARGAIRIDGPALDTVREALDTRETDR